MTKVFQSEIGPLKPWQRPLVMMLILLIPIVAAFTVSWLIFNYIFVANEIKKNEFGSSAVVHETMEAAVTANELALQLRTALAVFDDEGKRFFGADHSWSQNGERYTPAYIDAFVQNENDLDLLKEYFELSKWRVEFTATQTELENQLDNKVSGLSESTTKEASFQTERLVWEVERGLKEVIDQTKRLKKYGQKFDSYSEGKSSVD